MNTEVTEIFDQCITESTYYCDHYGNIPVKSFNKSKFKDLLTTQFSDDVVDEILNQVEFNQLSPLSIPSLIGH